MPSSESYAFDKNGVHVTSGFPSDEVSVESGGSHIGTTVTHTGNAGKRVNGGGYYEHEEEVFNRV